MQEWLQGRYQPAARPQGWQADRRWGSPGNEQPSLTWRDVVAGRIRAPQNRAEMVEAAKGVGAVAGATGGAYSAGQFGFDTMYHGEPWQTASWRALIGGHTRAIRHRGGHSRRPPKGRLLPMGHSRRRGRGPLGWTD